MDHQEKMRIDRITRAVHYLLKGRTPEPIFCENDPDDEIRQLSEKINELNRDFKEIKEFIVPLAQGRLDIGLPPRRNILASPFKQLHAALSHLTWQTQQIARGDFNQHVDFMGEFSQSFNSMTESLKEARSQLLSEIEKFRQLAEIKEHYLNVMAHDIRTPVGAVLGFADILLEKNLGDEERKHVRVIRRNCETLLALINNILDMAKLEKRKMEIVSAPVSILTLCEDLAAMIQSGLNDNVRFILDTDEQIPAELTGDPFRLQQVLINLAGNAAKFTKQGSITLSVQVKKQVGDRISLYFSVQDTGIGIAQDNLEKIFTPFSQADGTIAAHFGGTGLGLAISSELVSLMGGRLEVSSRLSYGTKFYFSLPFRIPDKTQIKPREDEKPPRGRCRILVVDDNPHALKIIANVLEKRKVRFTLCQDSTRAFDLICRAYGNKDPFTLAWLDIDMPEINGIELAAKIREDRRFNRLRLIACSSYIEKFSDSDSPSNFSFVAAKPVSSKALQRILDEAVSAYPTERDDNTCDLSGMRLLVVDDNPLNRFIIINILEKLNIEITEAENGSDGVNKVSEKAFDVVLMDKMMPVMNGIEAVRRIREIYDRDTLAILMFTAGDDDDDEAAFLSAGADGVVSKPIEYENMIAGLCKAMSRPRS